MTAAAIGQDGTRFGVGTYESSINLPVLAATKIFQGTLAMVLLVGTTANYVQPAAATAVPARVVGVNQVDVDNSAGASGDISAEIAQGIFSFINGATIDAFAATTPIGTPVFAIDDQTVGLTSGTADTRPYAGRFMGLDGTKVKVQVGGSQPDPWGGVDLALLAGADLSTTGQNLFVKANSTTLHSVVANDVDGGDCVGVLQNAPTSGAVAIVRVSGRTSVIASGTVNPNARVASNGASKSKPAVLGTEASHLLVGSFCLGRALTAGTTDAVHQIFLQPIGLIPTTAA